MDRTVDFSTDTHSLCYSIRTKDLYDGMTTFLDHLDTSSYPNDHPER